MTSLLPRHGGRGVSRVFTCFGLEERHGFLLSNPSPGADGASPSTFWMRTRSAFRNPFRVPLRTGFGILSFDSVRDGGGENPLLQPGEAGNSVEMGVARIEDERVLDSESGDPEVVRGDRRAGFF